MTETDTVKLLRECDVGIRMGIDSIDDVLPHVHSEPMHEQLTACRKQHDRLKGEIGRMLAAVGVGDFASIDEAARDFVKLKKSYTPSGTSYEDAYRAFVALDEKMN